MITLHKKQYKAVTLDFETFYSKGYTLSGKALNMSEYIRDDRFHVHCVGIKIGNTKTKVYEGVAVPMAVAAIDWSDKILICHNTAFDGFILSHHYNVVPKYYACTMSMAKGARSQHLRNSLDAVAKEFGLGGKISGLADTKGLLDLPKPIMKQLKIYCADDVDKTYTIFEKLLDFTTDDEMELIDITMRMFCDPVLKLDVDRCQNALEEEIGGKVAALMLAGCTASQLMSNQQFADLLAKAGSDSPMKISPTTGKRVFAFAKSDEGMRVLLDSKDEKIRRLAQARLKVKSTITETRATRMIEAGKDGMSIPVGLLYYGAHTGRWSGNNKLNFQNLPRGGELRKSIIAPKGHQLVVADSAQIEARVTAWLAGHEKLLQAFREKRDVYSEFASVAFGRKIDRKKNPDDVIPGFVGKTCIAEGTRVLTDRGEVPIQDIKLEDKLWDGIEWVTHSGLIDQGVKNVITYQGLTATEDHGVYTDQGILPFGLAASRLVTLIATGRAGQAVRLSEDYLPAFATPREAHLRVRSLYEMWRREMDQPRQPKTRENVGLQNMRANKIPLLRGARAEVRRHYRAMQQQVSSWLRFLWWPRHTQYVQLADGVHPMGDRESYTSELQESRDRSDQQRRALRARELTAGDAASKCSEPAQYSEDNVARSPGAARRFPISLRTGLHVPSDEAGPIRGADTRTARVFDVANAGPRKRFTAGNSLILNCILGLGFGMGGPKLKATLKTGSGGMSVDMSFDQCEQLVAVYRRENVRIVGLWKDMDDALQYMRTGVELETPQTPGLKGVKPAFSTSYKCLKFSKGLIQLPNHRFLHYYGLRLNDLGKYEFLGSKGYQGAWGGIITENIVQALARIIVAEQMRVINRKYRVCMMAHDELVCLARDKDAEKALDFMITTMKTPPEWAPDLPLGAEGGYAREYSK